MGRPARLALAAALAEGLVSLIVMMPVPLSYFSPLVGGLPARPGWAWNPHITGMRSTTRPMLVARSHRAGQTIRFATFRHPGSIFRQHGQLPAKLDGFDLVVPAWYVMQNRPAHGWPRDLAYVRQSEPVFTVRKLGVPLIWVFPYAFDALPDTRVR